MSRVLKLSLAVNAILVALAAWLWLERGGPSVRTAAAIEPATASRARVPDASEAVASSENASTNRDRITPDVVADLMRRGISREALVIALREQSNRQWDQELLELERRQAPRPLSERDYHQFARRREAAQDAEIRAALGEEGYREWDRMVTLRALNPSDLPLAPREADQAYRLQKEYELQHRELTRAQEDGLADPADVAALQAQAQATRDRQLEELLGKTRAEALRGSAEATADAHARFGDEGALSGQAIAAARVDADFRARESALGERSRDAAVDVSTIASEMQAIEADREQELRRIFGAAAYDEQQREKDATFRAVRQYAAAWELGEREVGAVYERLRALRSRTGSLRAAAAMREAAGQAVDWPALNTLLVAEGGRAESDLVALIGPERTKRLKQNGLLAER